MTREAGLIEPVKVAAWAEFFTGGLDVHSMDMPADVRAAIAGQLKTFSEMLRAMATPQTGSGRARFWQVQRDW
jgi:hypothetical protein